MLYYHAPFALLKEPRVAKLKDEMDESALITANEEIRELNMQELQ